MYKFLQKEIYILNEVSKYKRENKIGNVYRKIINNTTTVVNNK